MNTGEDFRDEGLEVEDLGEPIAELSSFEEDVSGTFLSRILSALHRRSLVGQVATMAWSASAQAFLEFLAMIFSFFDSGESNKKEGQRNG